MSNIHQRIIDKHILLLEIDNPPSNSLSKKIKTQLVQIVEEIENNKELRCVIITGSGEKFCTGDDLKEALSNSKTDGSIVNNLEAFGPMLDQLENLPIPTIAAINGWCIGGGVELALCCDIRIAVPKAKFITAGVNVGLVASAFRLPRLIGIGRAKRMLLTGQAITAQQAEAFGLVCDISEPEHLVQDAIQMAKIIANKAPLSIQATKRLVNVASNISTEEGAILWKETVVQLAQSDDHREALAAFMEKRKPLFNGK